MKLRFLIVLCSLAAAGCAVERTTPTETPPARAATTAEPAQAPALSALPSEATVAETPDTTPALASSSEQTTPASPAPKSVPTSERVAAAPKGPADHPGVGATPDAPTAPVASPPSAHTLDLAALGARLRTTKALGVLTKLSVKSQADDLLEQFRDYYARRSSATLPDLRRSYDMLVLKLLSLLQDGDPPLATDIDRSRAAIWDILSDQRKFIDSHLMAKASL